MIDVPDQIDLDTIRQWLGPVGFHAILRMDLLDYDATKPVLRLSLPFRDDYARIPQVGDYHGGVLAAFLDVAGTFAAALAAGGPAATVNLRTDYLRAPIKCDLIASGRVVRAGRSAIVVDADLSDEADKLYAVARGTWAPVPADRVR